MTIDDSYSLNSPSTIRDYQCDGKLADGRLCGAVNRAISNLIGMRHTETDRKPSGCDGRYRLLPTNGHNSDGRFEAR